MGAGGVSSIAPFHNQVPVEATEVEGVVVAEGRIRGFRAKLPTVDVGGFGVVNNAPDAPIGTALTLLRNELRSVGGATSFLTGGSGSSTGSIALLAGGVAAVVSITVGGWYTRRRWLGGRS